MRSDLLASAAALINNDTILGAKDRHQSALARLQTVRADLETARNVHTSAKRASEHAIADPSLADPHAADHAEQAAARAVAVAERVVAAAEIAALTAAGAVHTASGEAHQGVYTEGVRRRLAAAAKTDAAKAMRAEAKLDYADATSLLNFATDAGTRDVVFDRGHSHALTCHADEISRWGRNYHNAWWPGLSPEGSVR